MTAPHFCVQHHTQMFKSGKMKGFAHPILDDNGEKTGKWCNEAPSPEEVESKPATEEKKPWQARADSPEQRASIESQVAAKIIAELWIAGKTDEVNPLVVTLKDWLFEKLGVKPVTPGKLPPATVKPPVSDSEASIAPAKIDLDWVTESLLALQALGLEKWNTEAVLGRLNKMFNLTEKTIAGALKKLTAVQAKQVHDGIQKAKDEAKI